MFSLERFFSPQKQILLSPLRESWLGLLIGINMKARLWEKALLNIKQFALGKDAQLRIMFRLVSLKRFQTNQPPHDKAKGEGLSISYRPLAQRTCASAFRNESIKAIYLLVTSLSWHKKLFHILQLQRVPVLTCTQCILLYWWRPTTAGLMTTTVTSFLLQ